MTTEPQRAIRRDDIKRIPKEESGLGYDCYAKPSPDGRGWDVIHEVTENPFREAQRAVIEAAEAIMGHSGLNVTNTGPSRDKPVMLVYGGAFNPPHQGHVGALQDVHNLLSGAGYKVDGSIVSPTADKLLAKKDMAPEHRLNLQARANVARAAFPHDINGAPVMVDTGPSEEVERGIGKPRRSDLANWAQRRYPNHTIVNVTGEDAVVPGAPAQHPSLYSGEIGSNHEGINYLTMPRDEVTGMSSSKVRAALASGQPLPGMTPESERAYREELDKHRATLSGMPISAHAIHKAHNMIREAQASLEWQRSFSTGGWQLTTQDPSGIWQSVVTAPRVQTMYYAHKAIQSAQAEIDPIMFAHKTIREALVLLGRAIPDDEWNQHAAYVLQKLDEYKARGEDSRSKYGKVRHQRNGETHVRWHKDRRRQQNELLDQLYEQWAAGVPSHGKALVMGGLGGSGKGKAQRDFAPLNTSGYFTIDPDKIKIEMARRGMIPEVEGLSPMEASPLIHEEASQLAQRLGRRAYREKKNVLWDITMSSHDSVARRLKDMRKAGYKTIDGAFVDVDTATSTQRAGRRHRLGEETYRDRGPAYDEWGGRPVPSYAATANEPTRAGYLSHNAEVFDDLNKEFNNTLVLDKNIRVKAARGNRWGRYAPGFDTKTPAPTGPTPPNPAPVLQSVARRYAMPDPQPQQPTVKELVELYEAGGLEYPQLLTILASHDFHPHTPHNTWDELYMRSEEIKDDNSFFWIEAAEFDHVFTEDQVEEIADAIEQYHHQNG